MSSKRPNEPTLFDQPHVPGDAEPDNGMNLGVNRGPDHEAFSDDDQEESVVAKYMRWKERQERKERQQNGDMHGQAVKGASKVHMLRWAMHADDTDLDDEAKREADRHKGRLKHFRWLKHEAKHADGFQPDRHLCEEEWPYDDEDWEIPNFMTSTDDYEGYLATNWVEQWRHVIPTDVLEKAKTEDPSFL